MGLHEQVQAWPGGWTRHGVSMGRTGRPTRTSWGVRCSNTIALNVLRPPVHRVSLTRASDFRTTSAEPLFKATGSHLPGNSHLLQKWISTSCRITAAAVSGSSFPDHGGSFGADARTSQPFAPSASGNGPAGAASSPNGNDVFQSSATTPSSTYTAPQYGAAGPGRSQPPQTAWKAWLSWIKQVLQYRLMVLFRLPTWGKMLALVVVGLPTILIGSSLLRAFTDMTWHEAAQYAFYVLQNVPGTDITGFQEFRARLILILIHLISLYTFATLVGLLTEDVRRTVEEITSGNFPIPARKHTVILDASGDRPRLVNTIKKVLETRVARGGDVYPGGIAVLSTEPKDELDKLVEEAMQKETATVVTRHGCPFKVADLQRVAAAHAHTVLLLAPAGPMGHHIDPGLQQQLCLTALRSLHPKPQPPVSAPAAAAVGPPAAVAEARAAAVGSSGSMAGWASAFNGTWAAAGGGSGLDRRRQRVIVEQDSTSLMGPSSLELGGGRADAEDPLTVTYVSSTSSAARVAVQCAVQPGLAAVYDRIFCRSDGALLLLVPLPPQLQDRPFSEARLWFRRAAVCGLLPASNLNGATTSGAAAAAAAAAASAGGSTPSASTDTDSSTDNSDGTGSNTSAGHSVERSGGAAAGGRDIFFCPPDDLQLRLGDRLVLLSNCHPGYRRPEETPAPVPPLPPRTVRYDGRRSMLRRLVLVALDSELSGAMLAALEEFAAPGCGVTVVSPEPCRGLPSGPTPRAGLRLRNEIGSPVDPGVLARADVVTADAVILTGTDHLPSDEADALAVGTALLLQRLLADMYGTMAVAAAAAAEAAAGGGVAPWASLGAFPWLSYDAGDYYRYYGSAETSANVGFRNGEGGVEWVEWQQRREAEAEVNEQRAKQQGRQEEGQATRSPPGGRVLPTRPLTFVCSLTDPEDRTVLQHVADAACRTAARATGAGVGGRGPAARGLSVEVVEPKSLISGILAQVGAEPLLVGAFQDLLDEQGCEVYIKRTDRYGLTPQTRITWAQISEVVRRDGDVALGYLRPGPGAGLLLAPSADLEVAPRGGDKVVVLSESFL